MPGALGWVLLLGALGCMREPVERSVTGPRLEVTWTGADTGGMAAPAVAEWCGARRTLEIRGLHGDSGIAILLFAADTIRAGSYPVVPPARADSGPPAAAVALRWFAETALKGFRGDSGAVILEAPPGAPLSGRFSAALEAAGEGSLLLATGRFEGLTAVPAARGCGPRSSGQPADTGIH